MNNFEKQISAAARSLRDKQNAKLRVPASPRVSATKMVRPLIWWTGIAAALCVGYFLGTASPFRAPETPTHLAQLPKSEILRDTIFTTIRDTLFLEREVLVYVPTYIASPTTSNQEEVGGTYVSLPNLALADTTATTKQATGKNILDDTIHYDLLVSM
ncbi:MAG: hypothetical protein J6R79_01130 [Bacteroidaceae bacterium]|nr:hypothetical protein [Bacteroidaceae bacterium]